MRVAMLDLVPDPAVEPVGPTVQVVAAVVGTDLHLPAVEREATPGDPVRVAADRCADVRRGREVLGLCVVAPDQFAAADHEPVHGGAQVEQLQHRARRRPNGDHEGTVVSASFPRLPQ